jgi:predicted ferric reductase
MKNIWRGLFWINWIIILSFWFLSAQGLLLQGFSETLIALGRLAGLLATYMILVQFFLVGRNPLLEGLFGLDTLTRIHHQYGKISVTLLVLHFVFLIYGYSGLTGNSTQTQFLGFVRDANNILPAVVGLFIFVLVAGLSMYIVRSKLKYEVWYTIHLLVYIAIFLSILHQFSLGGTLNSHSIFYLYWILLYVFVFLSHIFFRFAKPLWLFHKHAFKVSTLKRESPTAVSISIAGKNLNKFPIKAGQFMFFRFLAKGFWQEAHPFSLSCAPGGKNLRITVRELGDFTRKIESMPVGTNIIIEGPYGVFTNSQKLSSKILLIAGGIGITPLRALAEEMGDEKKDIILLYANKTSEDIVFKKELEILEKKYSLRVVHVLSKDNEGKEEGGYIDEEKIRRLVPEIQGRDIFICGPVAMMSTLIPVLMGLGVNSERIHFEKFSLHS